MDHILNNSEKPIPTEEDLKADAGEDEDEEESAVKALEGQEAKVSIIWVEEGVSELS